MTMVALVFVSAIGCKEKREEVGHDSISVKSGAGEQRLNEVTIAQWGQEKYLIYLPLYVAMERGFFKSRGLKVILKYTGNDDQTFAAVIQGDADFGVGDPIFTAVSQARGFGAKVVATLVGGVAIWGVANNPSVPVIERPEDLASLRVGTFPEPSTNYALMKAIISANPGLLKDTRIVQAPIGSQLALVEKGEADIAMELEPAASLAEEKGFRVVYSSPAFHGSFTFTGLTVAQTTINERPTLVQSVVSALEDAVVASHQNPSIAVAVGRDLFPSLSASVVERAIRRMLDEKTYPMHVVVDESGWQAALRTRLQVGDLKEPQATSVAVDNTFANRAAVDHPIEGSH